MPNALILIILFVVATGVLIAVISYMVGQHQKSAAQARFASASLAELQEQAPELKGTISITSQLFIGNEERIWLETMLRKTFEGGVRHEEDVRFLDRQYAQLLVLVKEHLEKFWKWKEEYDTVEETTLTRQRSDAYPLLILDKSLEWLRSMADEREAFVRGNALALPPWDKEILAVTDRGFRQTQAVGFGTASFEDSLTIRANPKALEHEIGRLRSGGVR